MQGCIEGLDSPNITILLVNRNTSTPKVIIFCRRKQHMKELYELFSECLGEGAYYRPTGNEPRDGRGRYFAIYHKKTHNLVKETAEEFWNEDRVVRVLICLIAFGCGH